MPIKILVVDDERSLLDQIETFLEREGEIEVSTVDSAEKGLELIDEEDIDVIVSDYKMPEMDGLQFLERIREERGSGVPFIMFTGKGREEVAIKALNLGADRYIQKSGDPRSQYDVLVEAIVQEYKNWSSKRKSDGYEIEKSKILEITSDEIAYHDPEHNIIWANRSYLESAGKSLEEMKGEKCYKAWYGRDEPCEGCPTEKALKSGEIEKGEISPPETDRHWLITGTPVKDEERNITGVLESSLDITEQKNMKRALEKRNEKIKRLHDEVVELGKCESEEEICNLVIRTSESILDFEVCGIDFVEGDEFIPIALSSEIEGGFIRRKVEEAGISRKVYQEKESLLIEDRREIDFSKPVVSDYRSSITIPLGDFGIYQALSTEVGAFDEEDLELAEILVNHATEAISRLKSENELRSSKEKLERLHQASAELESCQSEGEVYSRALIAAEDILEFDMCVFSSVEEGKFKVKKISSSVPEDGSTERRIEEGGLDSKTYLNQRSYLVKDMSSNEDAKPAKGEYKSYLSVPIGELGIFEAVSTETSKFDMEDLRMTEMLISHVIEALKRLETEKREEFLHSLLRHDVGNKAQIIKGYLLLTEDYDVPEEIEEYLEKARQAAEDSIEVIEKIRKLRNIEKREEISEVEVRSVMEEALSRYEGQLQEKNIILERDLCDCKVQGGPLLEELFSNLIENSIRHSNCDKIRIHSSDEEYECIVTFEDDGIGISDELKDKIFDKGFRKGDSAGTGLGLYMVKEIAENYGGDVEVKDSKMGGIRFDVRLEKD